MQDSLQLVTTVSAQPSPSLPCQVAPWTWYYVISGEMSSAYTMHASELPPSQHTKPKTSFPKSLAFSYTLDGKIQKAMTFTDSLNIPASSTTDFQYWSLAPILNNGWALLGELNKIIPVSTTRFIDIEQIGMQYTVYIVGVPGEMVPITAYDTGSSKAEVYDCTISATGRNIVYLPGGPCVQA